jgi:hypothetical protein
MAEFHARSVKWNRARLGGDFLDLSLRHEEELGLVVYEPRDEPGASDAVNVDVGAGEPLHGRSPFLTSPPVPLS